MKQCKKCGEIKQIDQFYTSKSQKYRPSHECKVCTRERVARHRHANLEKIRAYDRSRGARQTREYAKNHRKEARNSYIARDRFSKAIRAGIISRKDFCEDCGSSRYIVAHHNDYHKPLEVTWLCEVCHKKWHAINGPGLNIYEAPLPTREPKFSDELIAAAITMIFNGEPKKIVAESTGVSLPYLYKIYYRVCEI